MSSRFAPLSYEKPKGLLRAKGQVLIERQIEQLQEAGINDITVVVGYMKEMFFYLADKYGVNIVINEDYYKYNNPSTLMRVKDKLKNTFICSSDDYFSINVFEPYVYCSYYAAEYCEGKTEEYCLSTDRKGRITGVKIGGENRWYMIGHAYFNRSFSDKFLPILEEEYKSEYNRTLLWENLYMKHIKELDMVIRRYDKGVIFEFDSLDELRSFDPYYINNTDSKILDNICGVLKCQISDIHDTVPVKQGLTNLSFRFKCKGGEYIYRHPGVGTDEYINRKSEAFSMQVASELGLDDTYIYMSEEGGWKISKYIENSRTLDYHNADDVNQAMAMARALHSYPKQSKFEFDIFEKIEEFVKKIQKAGRTDFEDFALIYGNIKEIDRYVKEDNVKKCICHCDFYDPNFIIDEKGKMYLIDWEYSGNSDPSTDLGTFICCSDYTYEEALNVIRLYYKDENRSERSMRHDIAYVALASFYWFVWAIFQESNGNKVGEYLMIWYKYSKLYSKKALELYR
ncbi:MAG: phosphotransferase, partial [[Eubacterium] siraeum]|nr:phosphotransferase [[Eubacterium] siraeum]